MITDTIAATATATTAGNGAGTAITAPATWQLDHTHSATGQRASTTPGGLAPTPGVNGTGTGGTSPRGNQAGTTRNRRATPDDALFPVRQGDRTPGRPPNGSEPRRDQDHLTGAAVADAIPG